MVYIDSAILGPDRKLEVNPAYDDLAQFGIIGLRDKSMGNITVPPAQLAEALNGIVPGFTASYERPVAVPQGVGSVVESVTGDRYARLRPEGGAAWTFEHNSRYYSDEYVASVLCDGGKVIVDTTPKSD